MTSRLSNVRWIGGGSGAGKTTVAHRLAVAHGLIEYSADDAIRDHASRCNPKHAPLLSMFLDMDLDERWVNRPPKVMFEKFPWFRGEGFDLIVDDLSALPEGVPILVEGYRLLPRLVAPLVSRPDQAVWLLPTREFRRRVFEARGKAWFPYETSDPARALANLLIRDELFTNELRQQTSDLKLSVIEVDGTLGIDGLTRRVGESLGLVSRSAA